MSRWERWKSNATKEGPAFVDFLQEQQSPAELAASMGLQSDGSGGYIDPETGQLAARTVNNELVFYDAMGGAISAQSGGAQLTQAQPSWVDPVTGEITVPPGQPESPEEIAAIPDPVPAQVPAGYSAFMNKKKKDMYASQSSPEEEMENLVAQQDNPEMGDPNKGFQPLQLNEPEPALEAYDPGTLAKKLMSQGPQPPKTARDRFQANRANQTPQPVGSPTPTPNSVKTDAPVDTAPEVVDNKMASQGKVEPPSPQQPKDQVPVPQSNEEVDIDDLRNKARSSYGDWTTAKITADDRMDKKFEPMMRALDREGVSPELRNRILQTHLKAYQYEGRDNEASSDLNKGEFRALMDNKDRIIRGYGGEGGDGSTHNLESIREFQREINDLDLDDDLIKESFAALSPAQQKIFKGGDMSALQGYKKYLRQHFKGGYTGLPLDMNTMQMEHFIDDTQARNLQALAKKEKRDMSPEEQELYDFIRSEDNQFWSRQGPNEQKSSRNIQQFFDERVGPLEQLGDDFFDFKEMKIDPARLDLKGKEKGLIAGLLDTDGDGQISLQEMDEAQYNSHRDAVNQIYDNEKTQLLEGLSQAFDPNGMMGMGPKAFENAIANADSPITEDNRSQYDMLRNLQSKIKGYNSNFEYRLMQSLGLPTNYIQSERSRSQKVSPEIYKSITSQLPGKNKKEQAEFLSKVKETFGAANAAANAGRGQGGSDADIRKLLYQSMMQGGIDNGIFTDEMFENSKELKKIRDRYLSQMENLEKMLEVGEDDHFDIEHIIEVVQQLLDMEEANEAGDQRGLTFESFTCYNKE